jgi:Domain of unknown function (DUF4177)
MTEWEYQVTLVRNCTVPEPVAEVLNESGLDGWELVAAIPTSGGLTGPALMTILKRPKGVNGFPRNGHLLHPVIEATAAMGG